MKFVQDNGDPREQRNSAQMNGGCFQSTGKETSGGDAKRSPVKYDTAVFPGI